MTDVRRRRVKAAWIDIGFLFIAFVVFTILAGEVDLGPDEYGLILEGWPFVLYLGFVLFYFFLAELGTGQTLGKRWMDLRVVDERSGSLTLGRTLLRTLVRLVDWLPFFYLAGYITIRATGDRQARLGDLAARTAVRPADSVQQQPGPLGARPALISLALVAAATLAGAAALTTADEEEGFVGEADRICARLASEAKPLEARLRSAQSASEAASAMNEVASFLQSSTSELSALTPPTSVESAWSDYIAGLERRNALAREAQEAAEQNDLEAYRSTAAEIDASRENVEGALEGFDFDECG